MPKATGGPDVIIWRTMSTMLLYPFPPPPPRCFRGCSTVPHARTMFTHATMCYFASWNSKKLFMIKDTSFWVSMICKSNFLGFFHSECAWVADYEVRMRNYYRSLPIWISERDIFYSDWVRFVSVKGFSTVNRYAEGRLLWLNAASAFEVVSKAAVGA